MNIKQLKYHQINFEKYDNCIGTAYNCSVYAFSWYLNIVSNNEWEVLILNDYEVVIPLPFARVKRKLLKKMVAQPPFCQQLGVFSLQPLDKPTNTSLIHFLNKNSIFSYHFNHKNSMVTELISTSNQTNFELNLSQSFEKLYKGYSKSLKRKLKKASKESFNITQSDFNTFFELKNSTKKHRIKKKYIEIMRKLAMKLIEKKLAYFLAIEQGNNPIAVGFFIENNNRIIHLFSASTPQGKEKGATAYLFNSIIEKNANSNMIFDFEGSMIDGVAQFFKSFGAVDKPYYLFTK